jgi:CheY-like chemotaxis protein/two-component sensor histidine kinase
MGTLAATVAHEIANPLTYVLANLDILGARVSERDRPLIADTRDGAERMRKIVRDLTAFSRDDDRSQPTDVTSVLERAVSLAELEIKHRARVQRDYRPVPLAVANDARLGQVFLNLLVNAAHAIPAGNLRANAIQLRTFPDGSEVVVEVEDTGSGISPELTAKIFEPFFTTKPIGAGTGLGLSICQRIVESFGGSIAVKSELGRGSTFTVRLPVAPDSERSVPKPEPAPSVSRRLRAIVIDDEAQVARAFSRILEDDHDVVTEIDPRRALERLIAGEDYDIVFCDLMMPSLSGMELHQALQRSVPNVAARLVFVTGGAYTPQTQQFLSTVSNPCLEKPIDRKQLERLLRERATGA